MRPVFGLIPAVLLLLGLASCQMPAGTSKNVAILYGISQYDPGYNLGEGPNLTFPTLDVASLAPLLSSASGGVFDRVVSRTETAATKAQLTSDFAAAAATMDENSVFLFYYSGHGDQGIVGGSVGVDKHAYILPYGSYQMSFFDASLAVTEDDLRDLLATLPTKKVIVIIDACFSGGFLSMPGASDGLPVDATAYYQSLWNSFLTGQAPQAGQDLSTWLQSVGASHQAALDSWNRAVAAGSGIAQGQTQLLTAAGALEESYDATEFQHGAFTHFLLDAKTKGDLDGNGYVTVSEAYRYAFDGIQQQWNGIWGAVGWGQFALSSAVFLPHLSPTPVDYILFKSR